MKAMLAISGLLTLALCSCASDVCGYQCEKRYDERVGWCRDTYADDSEYLACKRIAQDNFDECIKNCESLDNADQKTGAETGHTEFTFAD